MATLLEKDVTRETLYITDRKGRKQIVTLESGDVISFRGKGQKSSSAITVGLGHVRLLAEILDVQSRYRDEMEAYKTGLRKRKPKAPGRVFSKTFYQALERKPYTTKTTSNGEA